MVIYRADPTRNEVALMFDDGPNPKVTPQLLDVLKEMQVTANFFLIGARAEQSPEVAALIAKSGHEIGNHTYTHASLTQVLKERGPTGVKDEIERGAAAIRKVANVPDLDIRFLRPPYLDWNKEVAEMAATLYGDRIVLSGLAVSDYAWGGDNHWDDKDPAAITAQSERIVDGWREAAGSGTLLGFHDSSEHKLPGLTDYETWMNRALPTLAAIPHIIDNLRNRGLVIKRLSEMNLVSEAETIKHQ